MLASLEVKTDYDKVDRLFAVCQPPSRVGKYKHLSTFECNAKHADSYDSKRLMHLNLAKLKDTLPEAVAFGSKISYP